MKQPRLLQMELNSSGRLRVSDTKRPLAGKRIWVTAERRVDNQRRYLEQRGAEVCTAPLLQTIDDTEFAECSTVAASLIERPPDVFIAQTGQGMQWWTDKLGLDVRTELINAMSGSAIWARGAKAASRCRSLGLTVDWQSESESAREVAERCLSLPAGTRAAVQLVGSVNDQVVEALDTVEANVVALRVYRYALPADSSLCQHLIDETIAGNIDAITFTASPAIQHLDAIARSSGQHALLTHALNTHCRPVVVGPVCAVTAADAGWNNVVEPGTARLVPMLHALTDALDEG